jgi:hypothetical protein
MAGSLEDASAEWAGQVRDAAPAPPTRAAQTGAAASHGSARVR